MIDIAKEFGYKIRSFHHGVEAYKIADVLAREGISASVWADWGGFKMEAIDGVRANAAMVHAAGARAIIHSDSSVGSQRLNQEAAKAMAAGTRDRPHDLRRRRDQVDHDQPGVGARARRPDRLDRDRQERRRRAVVGQSVQRLRARREGLDRRRAALRSPRPDVAVAHRFRAGLRPRGERAVMRRTCCLLTLLLAPAFVHLPVPVSRPDDRHHRRQGLPGVGAADRERPPSSSSTARSPPSARTWRFRPAPRRSTPRASGSRRGSSTPRRRWGWSKSTPWTSRTTRAPRAIAVSPPPSASGKG